MTVLQSAGTICESCINKTENKCLSNAKLFITARRSE
jgi:hypothetical protein